MGMKNGYVLIMVCGCVVLFFVVCCDFRGCVGVVIFMVW